MKKPEVSIKTNRKAIPLDRYAGEWVAFANGRIVAHGVSLENLMRAVKRKRLRSKPSVLLVPKEDDVTYII
jgi:hypothetical protein